MKALKILAICAVAMGVWSCAKASEAAGQESFAQTQNAENSGQSNVLVPESDDQFRPGKSVDVPTVIDFNADWCGPCRALTPVFDMAAAEFAGKARFYSINVDKYGKTASAFGVRSIPYVLIISPDGTVQEHIGLGDFLQGVNTNSSEGEIVQGMYANMAAMIKKAL